MRGSVHGTPGEMFCTLTLDQVGGAACAFAAQISTATTAPSAT
jgi:hypothetical protein